MISAKPSPEISASIAALDAVLPQTQCTACGYPACRPYAEAIVEKKAAINLCEPGGEAVIQAIADLLAMATCPPHLPKRPDQVARIREEDCIGCARCLPACPVDAILGLRKHMHAVILPACTGCQLCLAPCPVDCIELVPRAEGVEAPSPEDNRRRYEAHLRRRQQRKTLHQTAVDKAQRRAKLIEKAERDRQARLSSPS